MKSFRNARIAFAKNLNEVLAKLNYSPASLSMKLNNAAITGGSTKSVVSASDINDWVNGKKVPSLYAMFKLCDYMRIGMDELLDPNFSIDTVIARSFANQKATAPKITVPVATPAPLPTAKERPIKVEQTVLFNARTGEFMGIPLPQIKGANIIEQLSSLSDVEAELLAPFNEVSPALVEASYKASPVDIIQPVAEADADRTRASYYDATTMTTANLPVTPVKAMKKRLTQEDLRVSCVSKHTTSTNYNSKLAYAVLTSGKTVSEIAVAVGASTRSLRDYMYYGVSIPEQIGKRLLKVLKTCNYATIGLKFDSNVARYTHA